MNITDHNRFAQEIAEQEQREYRDEMRRVSGMYNSAAMGVASQTYTGILQDSMKPNGVWVANGTGESSQTSRPALGGFTVHKAYNGFTVKTNTGDIILCPEIKDVGEQIVAYLIANKLEK